MPAATASSTAYWMSGLSTIGSISFGEALVAGRKRVPRPATGKTALRIFFMVSFFSLRASRGTAPRPAPRRPAPCAVELGAGLGAGDDEVGLLRDRPGDLAAGGLDALLRLVARHRGERSGEHDDFTREGARGVGARGLALGPAHAGGAQLPITSRLCGSAKKRATLSATTGPTSGACVSACASAAMSASRVPKWRARSLAVTSPTWRMPSAKTKRAERACPCCSRWPPTTLAADFSAMRSSAASLRDVELVEVRRRAARGPRRPAGRPACRPGPRCPWRGATRSAAAPACAAPGR